MPRQGTIKKRFTKEQLELEALINSLGFETVLEKQVGNYAIDIYIPEVNKGIEFDGPMHISKKRDRKRDKIIEDKLKCKIMRVTDLRRLDLKEELMEFICGE